MTDKYLMTNGYSHEKKTLSNDDDLGYAVQGVVHRSGYSKDGLYTFMTRLYNLPPGKSLEIGIYTFEKLKPKKVSKPKKTSTPAKKRVAKPKSKPTVATKKKPSITPKKRVAKKKAVKPAKKPVKRGRTIKTSDHQTGSSRIKIDKTIKALSPGKRKSASGSIYYEKRKNRSDMVGSRV